MHVQFFKNKTGYRIWNGVWIWRHLVALSSPISCLCAVSHWQTVFVVVFVLLLLFEMEGGEGEEMRLRVVSCLCSGPTGSLLHPVMNELIAGFCTSHWGFRISNKPDCLFSSLGSWVYFINCTRVILDHSVIRKPKDIWVKSKQHETHKERAGKEMVFMRAVRSKTFQIEIVSACCSSTELPPSVTDKTNVLGSYSWNQTSALMYDLVGPALPSL